MGAIWSKNPLLYTNGRYDINFDDLALKASDPNNTMMIICHPHNPVGRVLDPR